MLSLGYDKNKNNSMRPWATNLPLKISAEFAGEKATQSAQPKREIEWNRPW